MASNFPKLPGYVPDHDCTKVNHKKISHVKLEQIRNGNNQPVPAYRTATMPPEEFKAPKDSKSMSLSHNQFPNHFGTQASVSAQFMPSFVKLDKQVLRFYAYFKESVVESRLENFRLRFVTIFYFLEDYSIMITESKQTNSGIPQGAFLKRQMALKSDGSNKPFSPDDFCIGLDIGIFGRQFRIFDCDQFTRDFYTLQGRPQPDAQLAPADSFAKSRVPIAPKRDKDLIQYLEKSLGGGKVESQKQFLDHDRQVLRFYTMCEDLPYIVRYYLADDTLEIGEVHRPNDGRGSNGLLLRRMKLPDRCAVNQPGQNFIGDNYLTCDEIFPGGSIAAFGREYQITGVDAFTQNFYRNKYGYEFPLGGIEDPAIPEQVPIVIPPYNGFGDEVDTLGQLYKLIPVKPKGDFFKSVDNDKKILRYTAKFNTRVPEDFDRRFIISFYLGDDSISIYEPAQKNSGIVEGKFLERRKYKNVDNGNAFITPTDMPIGGNIKINGYSFNILSCDEYTRKYLEEHLQ